MKDVQYLSKDDRISFGTTNYKAISEEKVTSIVRESLLKNGIVITPIEQEHFKEGNLTTVNVKYKITNIDNPNEFEIVPSSGTGTDTQDKGVGKAMTYAYKYMLLRTFAIPTGEDPDKVSSEEWDSKLKKETKKSENKLQKSNGKKCEGCNIDVTDKVAMWSTSNYNKVLCMKCQKKEAKKKS
ncbi:hypothetical protein DP134_14060 [Clostridium tetani]|nr:hypothetical protein DP134_14060 [Clostridium tetani]